MKKSVKFTALILALMLILSSCAAQTTNKISVSDMIAAVNAGEKFHVASSYDDSIASADYIELSADKQTAAVAVKDKNTGMEWKTLSSVKDPSAYAFGVMLCTENGMYELNTQDNSVAFGTFVYEKTNNTLKVAYVLSDKKETAAKPFEEITAGDIYVSFGVTYSLASQRMTVTLDCGEMKCAPGSFVSSVSFMPCFGSGKDASDGDIIFVPDGSGAVMDLNKKDNATENVEVAVYGNDPNADENRYASATMPAFGMITGSSAFCAVITEGDSLATINASRQTDKKNYAVYPEFTVTNMLLDADNSTANYGKSYDGKITVKYNFLSGKNATYADMAKAARECFLECGYMSSARYRNDEKVPFCLSVAGAFGDEILATADQTADMLAVLKGKGINNIILEYNGIFAGGILQKNLYSSGVSRKLGGEKGVARLYDNASKQNIRMFVGANMISSASDFGTNTATGVNGEKLKASVTNDLAYIEPNNNRLASRITSDVAKAGNKNDSIIHYSGEPTYMAGLLKLSVLPDNFGSFITSDKSAGGIMITDAGYLLYSDQTGNREEAKNVIMAQSKAVAANCDLGVRYGNIYATANAKLISGMKFDTYYPESDAYVPVPFAQIVLHGYNLYTGAPIDAAGALYRFDMLQSIEYGAMPSFRWVFNDTSIFYYGYYVLSEKISEIVDFYRRSEDMLSGLADETIVAHEKVKLDEKGRNITGVYVTKYSNGTEIYVNYTGRVITTSGNIVVEPYNCIRVDR